MKKLVMLIVLSSIVLSCGTPKKVAQSKKVIKGYWLLDNITYSESGNFNVTMLSDVTSTCFEGSNWRFIPNNNTGIYTINGENCAVGDRHFIFTIQEVDAATGLYDFLLKPTNSKNKSSNNKGFRMNLTQLSDTTMQWVQTVSLENKPFKINMNFSKIKE
ncbi:lipocalin family protein [Lutibacter sp.]